MAYDRMQNLQSQLGKSLSLQCLMTVPRRNFPSDDIIWLQVEALNFLQLLRVHLPASHSSKIARKFKSLGGGSAMQHWSGLPGIRCSFGYNAWVLCEAEWIPSTTV